MIDSIEIRNYRNLNELKIKSFARVNLITGKNNIGKSSLLEAIAIYVSKADLKTIYQLLHGRGEYYNQNIHKDNILETNIKTFSSLFSNRELSTLFSIIINENQQSILSIRFVKYIENETPNEDGEIITKRIPVQDDNNSDFNDIHDGLEIKTGGILRIRSLEKNIPVISRKKNSNIENYQLISTRSLEVENNGKLFDNIALSEKEDFVIDALRIIEPDTEKVAFIGDTSDKRKPVIKLKKTSRVLPLQSMGDGINRIFTIILAMVNADNGYLLIDEFENGLHHTVQHKLWDIIFKLSERLNVQVFATTHSEDSIRSFQQILNDRENKADGKLIRLENKKGKIAEVEFNAEDLQIVANASIEVR